MAETFDFRKKMAYAISVLLHPIFIPLYTVILYFHLSPRYFLPQNTKFLILYLLIVTIIIPLIFLSVMVSSGLFSDLLLKKPRDRFFLAVIMAVIYLIILKKILHYHQYIELYPFFLGVFIGISTLAVYNWLGKKPSIHAMSVGGTLTFFIIWSHYTQINILLYLSLIILAGAIVIAARLYLKAHNWSEIIRGLLIGAGSQILAFYIALQIF